MNIRKRLKMLKNTDVNTARKIMNDTQPDWKMESVFNKTLRRLNSADNKGEYEEMFEFTKAKPVSRFQRFKKTILNAAIVVAGLVAVFAVFKYADLPMINDNSPIIDSNVDNTDNNYAQLTTEGTENTKSSSVTATSPNKQTLSADSTNSVKTEIITVSQNMSTDKHEETKITEESEVDSVKDNNEIYAEPVVTHVEDSADTVPIAATSITQKTETTTTSVNESEKNEDILESTDEADASDLEKYDFNCDGKIDYVDPNYILQYYSGLVIGRSIYSIESFKYCFVKTDGELLNSEKEYLIENYEYELKDISVGNENRVKYIFTFALDDESREKLVKYADVNGDGQVAADDSAFLLMWIEEGRFSY